MPRSLRFRLPALLIAGMLLAGVLSTIVAVQLYQSYTRKQAWHDLQREATGVAALYIDQAKQYFANRSAVPSNFAARNLTAATGDQIYFMGLPIIPGQLKGLKKMNPPPVRWQTGTSYRITFTPPGRTEKYIGVSAPLALGPSIMGAVVVARAESKLGAPFALVERLALAFLVGSALAGGLSWWLSRRITEPVLVLSKAADEIARGSYDVELPSSPGESEIAHLSERFRQMATRLGEAEKLERNFLMSVSHELRTPLTAIRGHALALSEGLADDPEAREASLQVIDSETGRLERLVGDILDLAKLDANRFTVMSEEVDMGRLFDQAYAGFSEEARRREIEYEQQASARPVIESDGDRVLQIISNLLSNAFRWTPPGGRVGLELSVSDGWVRVAVEDTGPGIPPDEQERIFRPFWSRGGGGTGLGLTIAGELAQALGGRIAVSSSVGQGSRFELALPAGSPQRQPIPS
ncbi:MAG: ATP-binding protein [Gaiellaceae bacterium]